MKIININSQILKFRKFLLDSWDALDALMEEHDWDNDGNLIDEWLQVNWEFLVERQLLNKQCFLNTIGVFKKPLRVTHQDVKNTHWVICKSKNNKNIVDCATGLEIPPDKMLFFHCFYKKTQGSFGLYPPFDYVEVFSEDGKRFYFSLDNIDFFLSTNENFNKS